ncbi:hypothetical protein C7M37_00623 [Lactiplantibacillus plantarum]|nr:hypothetical protein C1T23_01501 [Lactiplantibacillus plantarum]SPX67939.1 Uncharacterised protein [Lactiplantibacillus plantarum subsp. plantarum]MCG0555350.1 hypothetical protein [Lactiplantibacillus plantarum]MCG0626832.1 hypothetical protein [Lactiplantibacillus plantarum]MCG0631840.1 hypothetical protein [Lactiplantibacillus plantarum]
MSFFRIMIRGRNDVNKEMVAVRNWFASRIS